MIRNTFATLLPMIALSACVETSPLPAADKTAAQVGVQSGQVFYEFTNEWDTRPAPRALKDTFLKREAVRFCQDYTVVSRTPTGSRPGPGETAAGTFITIPTRIATERVRISCPA